MGQGGELRRGEKLRETAFLQQLEEDDTKDDTNNQ